MPVPTSVAWQGEFLALSPSFTTFPSSLGRIIFTSLQQMQMSVQGLPGFCQFNTTSFDAALLAAGPPFITAASFAAGVANAWEQGLSTATIVPSTTTDAVWVGPCSNGPPGSVFDVLTPPLGSALITNLSAAKTILQNGLVTAANSMSVSTVGGGIAASTQGAALMGTAFNASALALIFRPIGTAPCGAPTPVIKLAY